MPSRAGYRTRPDLDLLRMALMEQEGNKTPGRPPSALSMNAYLGELPETFEQSREADTLSEMDRRYYQSREDDRKRRGAVDDAKAQSTIRGFQTRTGVAEGESDYPSSSPATGVRTIRRFGNNNTPIDPDAAMTAAQRAAIDPRVKAAEVNAAGDVESARISASGRSKPSADGASSYALETANRTIQSIDEVLQDVDWTTSGAVGAVAKMIPGTKAADVSADLSSVAGNVAFNALQAMREASKTGGALGAISDKELDLLASVQGSIRQNQSPENLRKNLKLIRESQQRFLDASKQFSPADAAPTTAPTGADDPYEAYQRRRRK